MKSSAAMVMVNRLSTNHKGWLVPEGSGVERLNAAATMNVCVCEEEGGRWNFKGECISSTSLRRSTSKCSVYCHVILCVYITWKLIPYMVLLHMNILVLPYMVLLLYE